MIFERKHSYSISLLQTTEYIWSNFTSMEIPNKKGYGAYGIHARKKTNISNSTA